jgi:hypothetical protein
MEELIFTDQDFLDFREWINLNLDGITWQGRFKKEFELFWDSFFEDKLTLNKLAERFEYAFTEVKIGSLSSWFNWLRDKFINYVFIHKKITIEQLSIQMGLPISEVATILRNFFIDEYPHLDYYLSDVFQVGNILSPNIARDFKSIKTEIDIPIPIYGSRDEEIMPSMEITLFDEWAGFIRKMKHDFESEKFSFEKIQKRISFLKQVKVIQDVAVLFLLFIVVIYGIRQSNVWYEKYLMDKVSIYEPKFNWLNKSLVFKAIDAKPTKEFKLNFNEIKDITKGEKVTEFFDPDKYEEETEVTLTSFESLPKDFKEADKEASLYEGDSENPNGYRETKNGSTKIYRLMMATSNTYNLRDKISDLVKKYKAEPVGDSTPGIDVPGGVYYNVNIPKKEFKDFLSETMKLDQSKLFESNTSNVKNIPGKVRIFIMVKSI